jgi:hypothetical protein
VSLNSPDGGIYSCGAVSCLSVIANFIKDFSKKVKQKKTKNAKNPLYIDVIKPLVESENRKLIKKPNTPIMKFTYKLLNIIIP